MIKAFPKINNNTQEVHILCKHDGKKRTFPEDSTYIEFWALAYAKIKDYVNIIARDLPDLWKQQPLTKWKIADLQVSWKRISNRGNEVTWGVDVLNTGCCPHHGGAHGG